MQISKTSHEQIKTVSDFLHELSWLNDDLKNKAFNYLDLSEYTILKDFDTNDCEEFLHSVCFHAKQLFYEKVLMNCATMLDNCADPNLEVLDFNPEIKAGFEAIELLRKMETFISVPTNSIGFNSQFEVEIKSILSKVPVSDAVSA